MNPLKCTFLVICLFAVVDATAQRDDGENIEGIVLDSLTRRPIPDVHITTQSKGTTTDANGRFSIPASSDDEITLSHVGYHLRHVAIDTRANVLTILLQQRITVLKEFTFSAMPSEEKFRTQILETAPVISWEQAVANENSERMTGLGKFAPMPAATPQELFFQNLLGPKDVTILSSNLNSGLIGAIRKATRPQHYQYRQHILKYDPDWRTKIFRPRIFSPHAQPLIAASDTVATDSTALNVVR